jgi:hypothetical protein
MRDRDEVTRETCLAPPLRIMQQCRASEQGLVMLYSQDLQPNFTTGPRRALQLSRACGLASAATTGPTIFFLSFFFCFFYCLPTL